MQTFLAITFLAAVFVQSLSEDVPCSKIPAMVNLHNLAQTVGGWDKSEIPKIVFPGYGFSVEYMVKVVLEFKENYDHLQDWESCSDYLCAEQGLTYFMTKFSNEWAKVPKKYRQVLEDFVWLAKKTNFKLNQDYCDQVVPKTKDLLDRTKSFAKLNFSNYNGAVQKARAELDEFIDNYPIADPTNCAKLFNLMDCRFRPGEWDSKDWKDFPQNQVNQLKDFENYSEQVYEDLEKLLEEVRC